MMRKLTYSIMAVATVAAVLIVWSRTALLPTQASTAGKAFNALASDTPVQISPMDMMIDHKAELPIQTGEPF
jgi:hypothetical protein